MLCVFESDSEGEDVVQEETSIEEAHPVASAEEGVQGGEGNDSDEGEGSMRERALLTIRTLLRQRDNEVRFAVLPPPAPSLPRPTLINAPDTGRQQSTKEIPAGGKKRFWVLWWLVLAYVKFKSIVRKKRTKQMKIFTTVTNTPQHYSATQRVKRRAEEKTAGLLKKETLVSGSTLHTARMASGSRRDQLPLIPRNSFVLSKDLGRRTTNTFAKKPKLSDSDTYTGCEAEAELYKHHIREMEAKVGTHLVPEPPLHLDAYSSCHSSPVVSPRNASPHYEKIPIPPQGQKPVRAGEWLREKRWQSGSQKGLISPPSYRQKCDNEGVSRQATLANLLGKRSDSFSPGEETRTERQRGLNTVPWVPPPLPQQARTGVKETSRYCSQIKPSHISVHSINTRDPATNFKVFMHSLREEHCEFQGRVQGELNRLESRRRTGAERLQKCLLNTDYSAHRSPVRPLLQAKQTLNAEHRSRSRKKDVFTLSGWLENYRHLILDKHRVSTLIDARVENILAIFQYYVENEKVSKASFAHIVASLPASVLGVNDIQFTLRHAIDAFDVSETQFAALFKQRHIFLHDEMDVAEETAYMKRARRAEAGVSLQLEMERGFKEQKARLDEQWTRRQLDPPVTRHRPSFRQALLPKVRAVSGMFRMRALGRASVVGNNPAMMLTPMFEVDAPSAD